LKKLKNLVYISLGACALATVLRVLGVIFAFDTKVEYFDISSPISIAASGVLLAAVALCIVIGFAFRKKLSRDENFFKKTERVSFLLGAVLLAYGVFELYRLFALKDALRSNQLVWSVVGVLLCFVAAAYFLGSFVGSSKRSPYSMLLGFAFVFWCAYVMAVNYFDVYTTLNNPIKLSMQLSLIASMFCLLCEFRIRLGDEKRGQHLAFSLLSAILSAYFSIPTILCYALGKTQNLRYLFAAIACLAICAYALRVSLLFSQADAEADVTEADIAQEDGMDADIDNSSSEVENDG
jgi:hypothetical protein